LEAFFKAAAIGEPGRSAARLSARYATISELLSAEPAIVADYAGGRVAQTIAAARRLMISALEEELTERRPIWTQADAAEFLKALIGFRSEELLIVLFLDSYRSLIDYEIVASGTANHVEFDRRRIIFRAIGRGAAGLIIAHNHPSGDPRPSNTDIKVTRQVVDLARGVGICVHDHLVIAGREVRSAMHPEWVP
jgi:DNA repair protein RadC